jgi:hypothetical protein
MDLKSRYLSAEFVQVKSYLIALRRDYQAYRLSGIVDLTMCLCVEYPFQQHRHAALQIVARIFICCKPVYSCRFEHTSIFVLLFSTAEPQREETQRKDVNAHIAFQQHRHAALRTARFILR